MKQLDRITINPDVCLGQPTIRGMRITLSLLLKLVSNGMSKEEIMAAYPELEKEDIVKALKYAAWLASEKTVLIPVTGASVATA